MKEINIQIINDCNLYCKFCPRSNITISELNTIRQYTQTLEMFKNIVDECINAGINKICLTPRMGEVLLDNNLIEKLQYLNEKTEIKEVFFSTNFTIDAKDLLNFIKNTTKFSLQISHYGGKKKFKELTQASEKLYTIYQKNILYCISHPELANKLTFFQRYIGDVECIELEILKKSTNINYDTSECLNFNIGGLLKNDVDEYHSIERVGTCPTKDVGCILVNGDYNLCYMNDIFNETTQGNIFNTCLSDLKDRYINKTFKICEACNENWRN